eukprot:8490356-Lingulodinium_polyedra.AAC.1
MAAYREGLVAVPETVKDAPFATQILDARDREILVGFSEHALLPRADYEERVAVGGAAAPGRST